MITRILTSLIGLPLAFFFVNTGGMFLKFAVLFCSLACQYEIYMALSKKNMLIHALGYLMSFIYIFALGNFVFKKFLIVFSIFVLSLLVCLVFWHSEINITDCVVSLFGFFYTTFLLSFIILVRNQINGQFFVWLIFISSWGCDTFAYFSGRFLGKHKLMPKLSPKKTIEGSIGGSIFSVMICVLYYYVFSQMLNIKNLSSVLLSVICFIASVFAQLGDLSASAIKRGENIKDYGNILPGHGGFLDRFDSVLFTAPVIYLFLYFTENFGR